MQESFQVLLARARGGDGEARGRLLEQQLPALRAYVRLRSGAALRARESASDLVQSTCREVLADLAAASFDDEDGFRRWLWKAALHKILGRAEYYGAQRRDAARERPIGRGSEGGDALLAAYRSACSPSADAMAWEELARVERAFDALADEQREVILLARIERLPHREVAERMGKSEEAVRKLLSRARARLAVLLDTRT